MGIEYGLGGTLWQTQALATQASQALQTSNIYTDYDFPASTKAAMATSKDSEAYSTLDKGLCYWTEIIPAKI